MWLVVWMKDTRLANFSHAGMVADGGVLEHFVATIEDVSKLDPDLIILMYASTPVHSL
jgi:hypothetical protein